MLSKFSKYVARLPMKSRGMAAASFDGYGEHVFKGAIASPYLTSVGLAADTLDTPAWTSNGNADKVMIN